MGKIRLDKLLIERQLVDSRQRGQGMIMAGQVLVDGRCVDKAGTLVNTTADVRLVSSPRFVGRGGDKLCTAMKDMSLRVDDCVCADVGVSTGGFTDCLLQHGARRVYAIDVGKGVLHWRLRNDPRVVVMERTNARYVEALPEHPDLVTIDASFISLSILLPAASAWMPTGTGRIMALIKPQFEAGPERVGKGGVVRDTRVHRDVLMTVGRAGIDIGLQPQRFVRSALRGRAGNVEFFCLFEQDGEVKALDDMVADVA